MIMKTKFNYIIFLALLFLASSCLNNPELEPENSSQNELLQDSNGLDKFKTRVFEDFAQNSGGEATFNSIHELLGAPVLDAFVFFKTDRGIPTGFIPIFNQESKYTEGVIIVTQQTSNLKYRLLTRGQLYLFEPSIQASNNQPNILDLANVFVSFDRAIFNINEDDILSIIGKKPRVNGESKAIGIESYNSNDIASEWVEREQCWFMFAGTAEDPYQTFTGIDCYTEIYWESSNAGDPVMFDDNSGGGSGGSYTPNLEAVKKAEEARISKISDPEERRKAQLKYLKDFGGQTGKAFAAMVEAFLETSGLTVGDVHEINKIVQAATNSLINNYLQAIFGTSASMAKPFIELALFNGLSNAALQGISAVVKSKVAADVYNSIRGIKSMPTNTTTSFKSITEGNSVLNFEVGVTRTSFMNNLASASGKNWAVANSNASIFNLQHNGIFYKVRPFSNSAGVTVEVYKITVSNTKKLIAKYRLLGL